MYKTGIWYLVQCLYLWTRSYCFYRNGHCWCHQKPFSHVEIMYWRTTLRQRRIVPLLCLSELSRTFLSDVQNYRLDSIPSFCLILFHGPPITSLCQLIQNCFAKADVKMKNGQLIWSSPLWKCLGSFPWRQPPKGRTLRRILSSLTHKKKTSSSPQTPNIIVLSLSSSTDWPIIKTIKNPCPEKLLFRH